MRHLTARRSIISQRTVVNNIASNTFGMIVEVRLFCFLLYVCLILFKSMLLDLFAILINGEIGAKLIRNRRN